VDRVAGHDVDEDVFAVAVPEAEDVANYRNDGRGADERRTRRVP
jgi:hypothetical protein